jgi:hypothetical protein
MAYKDSQNGLSQLLLCFVIAGDTTVQPDEKRNLPPMKAD